MTEEIEAHVLKKYEILQKLGKYSITDHLTQSFFKARELTVLYGKPLINEPRKSWLLKRTSMPSKTQQMPSVPSVKLFSFRS